MKITAFTVVRNEDILLGHLMCHLASLADEVVVVVQPSTDATEMIARDCAEKLPVPCRVVLHDPPKRGWEFSLVEACRHASHDWVFCLNADESYVGADLHDLAQMALDAGKIAVTIRRWHAIAVKPDDWFKTERYCGRTRVFLKDNLKDGITEIHNGLESKFSGNDLTIPQELGRILEYKAPWQHYRNQLFYHSRGVMNEKAACEIRMRVEDIEIGRLLWERMRQNED